MWLSFAGSVFIPAIIALWNAISFGRARVPSRPCVVNLFQLHHDVVYDLFI